MAIIDNNIPALTARMQKNVGEALTAMGIKAVGLTVEKMVSGYGAPIWDTGTLMRSITFERVGGEDAILVGSPVEYAVYVHDGTSKMAGRPFLRDAILEGADALKAVALNELRKGV